MDTTGYVILGIYTVIYLLVFIYQKVQMDRQKDLISSMEKFINIFNPDKVESYVKLSEKEAMMKANELVREEIEKSEKLNKKSTSELEKLNTEVNQLSTYVVMDLYRKYLNGDSFELLDESMKVTVPSQSDRLIKLLKTIAKATGLPRRNVQSNSSNDK